MKKTTILLMFIALILFVGCSKEDNHVMENNNENDEFVETAEPGKIEEPGFKHVYPLTGIGTDDPVDQRVISVMINNHPAARPQTGLSQADVVFEILAEGNITRFLALFQSKMPDIVGPVRSAREYYFELAQGYDALYVFHGAIWFVKDMIIDQGIDHLDGSIYDNDGRLFKRESFRKAPHNSYLLFDAVNEVAEEQGYDILSDSESLPFAEEDAIIEGYPATHVTVTYPGRSGDDVIEYKYDEAKEIYTRFDRQVETGELNTNEPIEMKNIFILETPHQVIDDEGRRTVDIRSGGSALLMQNGKIQELEWMNKNGLIIPVKDGQPIGFLPGKTWINIVPSSPGLEQIVNVSNE